MGLFNLFRRRPREDNFIPHPTDVFRDNLWRDIRGQIDYVALKEYAIKMMESYERDHKTIDDKADSILRNVGGGSVFVFASFVVTLRPAPGNPAFTETMLFVIALAAPALVLSTVAVFCALSARRPRRFTKAVDIEEVVRTFEAAAPHVAVGVEPTIADKAVMNRHLIALYNEQAASTASHLGDKSRALTRAYLYYTLSIVTLFVPTAAIIRFLYLSV